MPRYRIHCIKQAPGEAFRWAPHTGGVAVVKLKDYEPSEEAEAATPYALWLAMKEQNRPLHPGDILETLDTKDPAAPLQLFIVKYIGFEPAVWFVPEPKVQPPPEAFDETVNSQTF